MKMISPGTQHASMSRLILPFFFLCNLAMALISWETAWGQGMGIPSHESEDSNLPTTDQAGEVNCPNEDQRDGQRTQSVPCQNSHQGSSGNSSTPTGNHNLAYVERYTLGSFELGGSLEEEFSLSYGIEESSSSLFEEDLETDLESGLSINRRTLSPRALRNSVPLDIWGHSSSEEDNAHSTDSLSDDYLFYPDEHPNPANGSRTSSKTKSLALHPQTKLHESYPTLLQEKREKILAQYQWPSPGPLPLEIFFRVFMESFAKKTDLGLSIINPVTYDPFEDLEEFKNYLAYRKTLSEDMSPSFVKMVQSLLELEIYQENVQANIDELEIDPDGLLVVIDAIPYGDLIKEIQDPQYQVLKDLYQLLVTGEELPQVPYLDESDRAHNGNCEIKKQNLAKFFNEITGQKDFIANMVGFGSYSNDYNGSSEAFKQEILYKTLILAEKIRNSSSSLDKDQWKFIIQGLLHAGRHCPDAKSQVINNLLFPSFCGPELEKLEEQQYPKQDLYSQAYLTADKLKRSLLASLLQEKMPGKSAESMTMWNATWDLMAEKIGVQKVHSPYPGLALSNVKKKDFLDLYTPKILLESYLKANMVRYQEELGPMVDFAGTKYYAFKALAELQRYGLLRARSKEVREEIPKEEQ